jgi:hypothetical protein
MIFTTNKPLSEWGKVLDDEDLTERRWRQFGTAKEGRRG